MITNKLLRRRYSALHELKTQIPKDDRAVYMSDSSVGHKVFCSLGLKNSSTKVKYPLWQ
jgi:hypothetical protein